MWEPWPGKTQGPRQQLLQGPGRSAEELLWHQASLPRQKQSSCSRWTCAREEEAWLSWMRVQGRTCLLHKHQLLAAFTQRLKCRCKSSHWVNALTLSQLATGCDSRLSWSRRRAKCSVLAARMLAQADQLSTCLTEPGMLWHAAHFCPHKDDIRTALYMYSIAQPSSQW